METNTGNGGDAAITIGIRGRGLIGGSFEKAFSANGYRVLDLKNASPERIRSCGVVIVCLPPLLVAPWIIEHAADFADGALVTDAAGVKAAVCGPLEGLSKTSKWTYVGGHPMAGRERGGYENATADLFAGASMIFTPYAWTDRSAVERLEALFSKIGFGRFVTTDPDRHDRLIAYTSQLAHVVSSAYVRDPLAASHSGFSAGSFHDMTRVATVDPEMWTDLFLSNGKALDEVLSRLIDRLEDYRTAIRSADAGRIRRLLEEGRMVKESVS